MVSKKLFLLLILKFSLYHTVFAQYSYSLNQYPVNPFSVNPSFAGYNNKTEIFLTHRQQWLGIQDAPVVSALHSYLPLTSSISVGMAVSNFSRGLLSTNEGSATFAYKARFSPIQGIRLGITAGGGNQNINTEKASNVNDPALYTQFVSPFYLDGKFGVTYYYQKFNLGFSLTDLFAKYVTEEMKLNEYNPSFMENYNISASYEFDFGSVALQPFALYRVQYGLPHQYEAGGLLTFNQTVKAGASYRQDYGLVAYTGFNINSVLAFNYSYEFAPQTKVNFGAGSHEIQLALSFKRNIRDEIPTSGNSNSVRRTSRKQVEIDSTGYQDNEFINLDENRINKLKLEFTDVTNIAHGNVQGELQPGYYLVASDSYSKKIAKKEARKLSKQGLKAAYGYSSKVKKFYVFLLYTNDIVLVRKERDSLKDKRELYDTWILKID